MSQILNNAGPFSLFNYSTDVGFGKLYITKKQLFVITQLPSMSAIELNKM